jgi:hypothetical protein
VYKNDPWGMINIDNVYTRPASANLSSDLPYASWKAHSGVVDNEKYLYTLPYSLYQLTGGKNTVKYIKDSNKVLNPYF